MFWFQVKVAIERLRVQNPGELEQGRGFSLDCHSIVIHLQLLRVIIIGKF